MHRTFGLLVLSLTALSAFGETATVAFETESFDLATGTVVNSVDDPLATDTGDLRVGYHADRTPHAVAVPGPGAKITLLSNTPFTSVDGTMALSLSATAPDFAWRATDTVVIETTSGARYKLGNVTEDASSVTFDFELL